MSLGGGGSSGNSSGGGSQGSGKVSWPSYLQNAHDDWIRHGDTASDGGTMDMEEAMYEAWDASPYAQAFAYDPTDDVASMHARFGTFDEYVGQLSPLTNWSDQIDYATAKFDETFPDSYINDLVDAYEERANRALNRNIGRFTAGMADVNAVNGSAFIMGMAMLSQDKNEDVDRYSRELTAQRNQQRIMFATQGANDLFSRVQHQIQMQQSASHMNAEITRVGVVAKSEYTARDIEIAVQNRTWNMQLWQPGANLLASVSGGTSTGGSTTKGHDGATANSMIGGAVTGGIGGALAGTAAAMGPWGIAGMVGLGALGGSGIFGGKN